MHKINASIPHSHDHHKKQGQRLWLSIFLNLVITIAQVIGGLVSGSLSLLSDAFHNMSDVFSLVVSLVAQKVSKRKQTSKQTYGYKRSEIIAAFLNSASLIVISGFLIKEAIHRLLNPESVLPMYVIVISAANIVLNGASVWLLYKDSKENMNIKSAYVHLMTDMFSSLAVLIGGLLVYFYQVYWVDAVLTLLIAGFLVFSSYSIFTQSLGILMQFAPRGIDIGKIQKMAIEIESIKNIHHIHIWQLSDHQVFLEAHLDFKTDLPLSEANTAMRMLATNIKQNTPVNHITFQPEFDYPDDKNPIVQDAN